MPSKVEDFIKLIKNDLVNVCICFPGDAMFLKFGDYHAVMTVFPEGNF